MKRIFAVFILCVLFIILCLPAAAAEEMLDKDADPAEVVRSGSFEATDKTKMKFTFEGGTLTGAKWNYVRHAASYSLEGTFKEGESITIAVTGTESPLPDEKSRVFNYMKVSITFFDKGYKPIGEEQTYWSDYVKDGTISYILGSIVPSGTIQVSVSASFNCRWASPYVVIDEGVAIYVTLKPEKTPPAALPIAPESDSKPESEETSANELIKPEPVKQTAGSPADDTAGEQSTAIKTAAIIGIAATIASLGAAGVAGSTADQASESKTAQQSMAEAARNKTGDFRMVIYKTFGDTIEFEKPGQEVYARIESADPATGMWMYDNARSMALSVGFITPSQGLTHQMVNRLPGKGRGVLLDNKNANPQPDTKATLIFRYTAPDGGYFERQMVFKLAGKPEIIIDKNTNILSTEDHYDLPFRLIGCGENPQINFICTSGLIKADMSVGFEEKKRFLRLSPGEDALSENQPLFFKPVQCTFEVQYGSKPEDGIKADLEITLCYEGIGTAYKGTPVNKTPDIITIPCDADKDVREKNAYVLPITVMLWNMDKRILEPDTSEVKALKMEVHVRPNAEMAAGSEAFKKAQAAVDNAKIALCDTQNTADIEQTLSPVVYGLRATEKEADDYIDLILTFMSDLPQIPSLHLDARTSNDAGFKAMIRWLITYPEGSYISQFIKLGDVRLYHKALDHVAGVYQYDKMPASYKHIDSKSISGGNAYYSHRTSFNEPYIAMKQVPKDIGDLEGIALLYHELTHTLEDIIMNERGANENEGSERHGYLVENLALAAHHLCNAEKGIYTGANVNKAIRALSEAVTDPKVYPWLTTTMSATLANFGAKYTIPPKEMFYHYATAYSGANAGLMEKAVRQAFCPVIIPDKHQYTVTDGLFKGAVWFINENINVLHMSHNSFEYPGYTAEILSREWVPDKEKYLVKVHMTIQKNGSSYKEYLNVLLEGNIPYRYNEVSYVNMLVFHVTWKLGTPPDSKFYDPPNDSIFFNNREQTSMIKLTSR